MIDRIITGKNTSFLLFFLKKPDGNGVITAVGYLNCGIEKYSTLGKMQLALSKVTINGWRFDIYGEAESQELRIFSIGFPGVESREMEKKAIAKEIAAATERNDKYAHAWFSGEPGDMSPLEE